jgi:hypothetical protein
VIGVVEWMVMDGRYSAHFEWKGSVLYSIVWCEVYGSVRTSSSSAVCDGDDCNDDDHDDDDGIMIVIMAVMLMVMML